MSDTAELVRRLRATIPHYAFTETGVLLSHCLDYIERHMQAVKDAPDATEELSRENK
jgi:hypothetical protein